MLPLIQRLPQVRPEEGFYLQLDIIDALGKLGDSRAIKPLITWFDKPNPYFTFHCDDCRARETMVLRQRIVAALGNIGDPSVLEWLQARAFLLRNHDWSLGQETLAKTLSTLKTKRQA